MITFLAHLFPVLKCFYDTSTASARPWAMATVKSVYSGNADGMYDDCKGQSTKANKLLSIIDMKSRALSHHLNEQEDLSKTSLLSLHATLVSYYAHSPVAQSFQPSLVRLTYQPVSTTTYYKSVEHRTGVYPCMPGQAPKLLEHISGMQPGSSLLSSVSRKK